MKPVSPFGLIVIALAVLWMASMLVAGFRYAANARASAGPRSARSGTARTYAEVRRRRG